MLALIKIASLSLMKSVGLTESDPEDRYERDTLLFGKYNETFGVTLSRKGNEMKRVSEPLTSSLILCPEGERCIALGGHLFLETRGEKNCPYSDCKILEKDLKIVTAMFNDELHNVQTEADGSVLLL